MIIYEIDIFYSDGIEYLYKIHLNGKIQLFDNINDARDFVRKDAYERILNRVIELWDENTFDEEFVNDIDPYITAYKMIKEDIDNIIKYTIVGDDNEKDTDII